MEWTRNWLRGTVYCPLRHLADNAHSSSLFIGCSLGSNKRLVSFYINIVVHWEVCLEFFVWYCFRREVLESLGRNWVEIGFVESLLEEGKPTMSCLPSSLNLYTRSLINCPDRQAIDRTACQQVIRRSLTGELSLSCAQPTDWLVTIYMYVGKPSAIGQPTRPT